MYPPLAPFVAPTTICPTCSKVMRIETESQKNGKLLKITYFCDSEGCRYGFKPTLQHNQGDFVSYVASAEKPRHPKAASALPEKKENEPPVVS